MKYTLQQRSALREELIFVVFLRFSYVTCSLSTNAPDPHSTHGARNCTAAKRATEFFGKTARSNDYLAGSLSTNPATIFP